MTGPDLSTEALEHAAPENDDRAILFLYTNWRGERDARKVTPISIRWGATKWHPEPGWLLRGYDHDKNAEREFALRDCNFSLGHLLVDVEEERAEAAAAQAREEALREAAAIAAPPLAHRTGKPGIWRQRRAQIAEDILAVLNSEEEREDG